MTDEMVERALDIVKATDGIELAKQKADDYLDRARIWYCQYLPPDIREAF